MRVGWNVVIKTIKGRRYRYRQRTVRIGKCFKTENDYLGPVDAVYRSKVRGAARLQATASMKVSAATTAIDKPLEAAAMAAVGHATELGTVAMIARILDPESETDRRQAMGQVVVKVVGKSEC